ncbi:splicing factor Prp8 [Guillardia theta]|uniref:Splicing factor Prp8 n=3 Tax=Guillardia theta TaxID=55529 RepID=Q9AW36_GUITH|nr:splicing factor Prp8 [Guillardia theta]CAC27035.1 splicing factor Prp8 [Guillardia theta]
MYNEIKKFYIYWIKINDLNYNSFIRYNYKFFNNRKYESRVLGFENEKNRISLLNTFRYYPLVFYRLLESIPMPWDENKRINFLSHKSESFYIPFENYRFVKKIVFARWSNLWFQDRVLELKIHRINRIFIDDFKKNQKKDNKILKKSNEFYDKTLNNDKLFKNLEFFEKIINLNKFKTILLDKGLVIKLLKIEIKSGLILSLKNKEFFKNHVNSFNYPKKKNIYYSKNNNNQFFEYNLSISNNYLKLKLIYIKKFLKYFPDTIRKNKKKNLYILNKIKYLPKTFFDDLLISQKKFDILIKLQKFGKSKLFDPFKIKKISKISIEKKILQNYLLFFTKNYNLSYHSMLKNYVKNSNKIIFKKKMNTILALKKNFFFITFKSSWISISKKICLRGKELLNILIRRKKIDFLKIDDNFNLESIKILTTKERKKSRFGNSFHLCREIFRFLKLINNSFVYFSGENFSNIQLANSLQFIFCNLGSLTSIYRYKYKTLKQIKFCKQFKILLLQKVNKTNNKNDLCLWLPFWRIWLFFLRGISPLLTRWINNLLTRYNLGRSISKKKSIESKQRLDSFNDYDLKLDIIKKVLNFNNLNKIDVKYILRQTKIVWKRWKAHVNWFGIQMNRIQKVLLKQYIKQKAKWWIMDTFIVRKKIIKNKIIDKKIFRKNLSRLSRLWMKSEIDRQKKSFSHESSFLSDRFDFFNIWLNIIDFKIINFPKFYSRLENKLALITISGINNFVEYSENYRLKEFKIYNLINFFDTIKSILLTQKNFIQVSISFSENFFFLRPIYHFDLYEKLTCLFLDKYFWYLGSKQFFFPKFVKPCDTQLCQLSIFNYFKYIEKIIDEKKYANILNCFIKIKINNYLENLRLINHKSQLSKVFDDNLLVFIFSRNNCFINYKDMNFFNAFGIIKGFALNNFIIQLFYFIVDISSLGIKNIIYVISSKKTENSFFEIKSKEKIIIYMRYIEQIYIFQIKEGKNTKIDYDMYDHLKKNFRAKLEKSILKFNLNFKLEISIICRHLVDDRNDLTLIGFSFQNLLYSYESTLTKKVKKNFIFNNFKICNISIKLFQLKVKNFLLTSGSSSFSKLIKKWNGLLLGYFCFFRKALVSSQNFTTRLKKYEKEIIANIKASLSSKMPSRFPPVLFFSPKEFGGLGMLSLFNYYIPENDLKSDLKMVISKSNSLNYTNSLTKFIKDWTNEFKKSNIAWKKLLILKKNFKKRRIKIYYQKISNLFGKGIPRIETIFSKYRLFLPYDYGWRLNLDLSRYILSTNNSFWWTSPKHEGKLYNLSSYNNQMIFRLGGIKNILEHTLFKATFYSNWEGLFWEKRSKFENLIRNKKLTNAQKLGLNQIPNRRFTLWWSPTINRNNVYIGYQTQIDLTGIFMHGKIPTLKISIIQIFRSHLWQKIHESLVILLLKRLDIEKQNLNIGILEKKVNHPKKSYKFESSSADLILYPKINFLITYPILLGIKKILTHGDFLKVSQVYWIDVQLRWGDFDSHDIERYVRMKYYEYNDVKKKLYPSGHGILIAYDLCYNVYSSYGNWILGLSNFIKNELFSFHKNSAILNILRSRIRKSLQIYQKNNIESNESILNIDDFFKKKCLIVDDSCLSNHLELQNLQKNKVINYHSGFLFIFNPINGLIYIKNLNCSKFNNKKNFKDFSKIFLGNELVNFLKTCPKFELPLNIITLKKGLKEFLHLKLIEYPDINVYQAEIDIMFRNLLKLNIFKDKIHSKNKDDFFIIELYDNWLDSISPITAFTRLILILKSIELDNKKVINAVQNKELKNEKLWNSLSNLEWINTEIFLKNLILKHNFENGFYNLSSIDESTIKCLILGSKLPENDSLKNFKRKSNFKILKSKDSNSKSIQTYVKNKKFYNNIIEKNLSKRIILNEFKNDNVNQAFINIGTRFFIIPYNFIKIYTKFLIKQNEIEYYCYILGKFCKHNTKCKLFIILKFQLGKTATNPLIYNNMNLFIKRFSFLGFFTEKTLFESNMKNILNNNQGIFCIFKKKYISWVTITKNEKFIIEGRFLYISKNKIESITTSIFFLISKILIGFLISLSDIH